MTHARILRSFALCTLLATSAVATGCSTDVEPEEEQVSALLQALPKKNELQIKLPGAEASDSEQGTAEQPLVGEQAEFYEITRDVASSVNSAAHHWLGIVEDITDNPPSAVSNTGAQWGPHTPALSLLTYKFVVTKDSQGDYGYALVAKVKNQPDQSYLPVLEGTASGDPNVNGGAMRLRFNNLHSLDPSRNQDGLVEFSYGSDGLAWKLNVNFNGFVDYEGDGPIDALYHYRELADQSGDFAFLTHSDVQDNNSADEIWLMRTRWMAGGSGRSDVVIVGGDLGDITVNASECWDEMFKRTYWTVDPGYISPAEGSAASCVFDSAAVYY